MSSVWSKRSTRRAGPGAKRIGVVGGNQSDRVSRARHSTSRALGFRRLGPVRSAA